MSKGVILLTCMSKQYITRMTKCMSKEYTCIAFTSKRIYYIYVKHNIYDKRVYYMCVKRVYMYYIVCVCQKRVYYIYGEKSILRV